MSNKSERVDFIVHDSDTLHTAHWTKSFSLQSLAIAYAASARGFADTVTITVRIANR